MAKIPYSPTQQVGIAREAPAYQQIDMRGLADSFGAGLGRAAVGAGQAIGGALSEIGGIYQLRQEQSAKFDAERRFQELNGELHRQWQEVRRGTPVNGEGLPEKMSQTFQNLADESFLKKLPAELQQRYAPRVENLRQDFALKSITEKFKMQDAFSQTTLNDRFQEEIKGIMADPSTTDARMAALGQLIKESTLPDDTKESFAKQAVEGLRLARARREAQDNPELVAAATGGLEGALRQRESSNNPRIVNQFGYAGSYQFGAPRLATMGVYTPGANENLEGWSKTGATASGKWSGTFNIPGFPEVKTLQDFLANPQAQRKAYEIHDQLMDQEIDRNGFRQYVGQTVRGIPITVEGLKAGLHLGGIGGVQKFFSGEDSADANGTKVASYIRMGAGVQGAPSRYAGVPLDKLERAMNDGINERARDESTATALRQAQNKQQIDALMLAIDRGQAGKTEIEGGRQQGWLDDAATLRAENALDALNKKTEDLRVAQTKLSTEGYGWNPLQPDDRKSVNTLSDKADELMKPAERMTYDVDLWQRTGIASDNLMRDVAGGLVSNNSQRVEMAANVAANMLRNNPNAFVGAVERDRIEKAAISYMNEVKLNRSGAEAAKKIALDNDPVEKAKRLPGPNQVQEFQKKLNETDMTSRILGEFNPGFFGQAGSLLTTGGRQPSAADIGLNPMQKASVVGQYKDLVMDYYKETGDESKAHEFAKFKMNQQFGISNGRLLQFPPEKAAGVPAVNGKKDWVYQQAAKDIMDYTGKPVKPEEVRLIPTIGTRDAFISGKPVPYEIQYLDNSSGFPVWEKAYVKNSFRGVTFVPDAAKFNMDLAPEALTRGINAGIRAVQKREQNLLNDNTSFGVP